MLIESKTFIFFRIPRFYSHAHNQVLKSFSHFHSECVIQNEILKKTLFRLYFYSQNFFFAHFSMVFFIRIVTPSWHTKLFSATQKECRKKTNQTLLSIKLFIRSRKFGIQIYPAVGAFSFRLSAKLQISGEFLMEVFFSFL